MMNAVAFLSSWKEEGVTPSTLSVTLCKSTSSASKTTMSSELAATLKRKRQQKEEDNNSLKVNVEPEKERNKVVNHHQICCHLLLHQGVMIVRLEENNKELQHKGDMDRG
eukprot:1614188-Ditylum_brightwellii.AAC.1